MPDEDFEATKIDQILDGHQPAEPLMNGEGDEGDEGAEEPDKGAEAKPAGEKAGKDAKAAEEAPEGEDEPEGNGKEPKPKDGKGKTDDAAVGLTKGIAAERAKRQAAEAERDRLKAQLEGKSPPAQPETRAERPDPKKDPDGAARWDAEVAEERAWNERVALTQSFMKRVVGSEDYDEKENAFLDAYADNAAMMQQLRQSPNPAEFAYEQGKKIIAQREIGDDPNAYREKVRGELLEDPEFIAEVAKKLGVELPEGGEPKEQPKKPAIPKTLAHTQSAAPRDPGKQFAGPTPLAAILPD